MKIESSDNSKKSSIELDLNLTDEALVESLDERINLQGYTSQKDLKRIYSNILIGKFESN